MGPVFWENLYASERMPEVLQNRYRDGGDFSKFILRHPGQVSAAVAELVQKKHARGRLHTDIHTQSSV